MVKRIQQFGTTSIALSLLIVIAIVKNLLGFTSLHQLVKHWPRLRLMSSLWAAPSVELLCAAVQRALGYAVTPVLCLTRAATTVCLLRLFGISAEFVLGVQRMPFGAHAWVQVDGQIINEPNHWKNTYKIIDVL